jgi:hypothetical protein
MGDIQDNGSDAKSIDTAEEDVGKGDTSEERESDTSTSVPNGDSSFNEQKEIEKLINRENKEVRLWRILVTFMLFATTSLVTFFSYKILVRNDRKDFENGVSSKKRFARNRVYIHSSYYKYLLPIVPVRTVQRVGHCYCGLGEEKCNVASRCVWRP